MEQALSRMGKILELIRDRELENHNTNPLELKKLLDIIYPNEGWTVDEVDKEVAKVKRARGE